ncbi:hypothetical protein E2C01_057983 [Portunus trituberculatus]|uniref:Uncharacterized protein n=1 Tax=Portunus trituberculatus TaxID=210409 RepID=A0A5B7H2J8_PORTR|nr:hypothetical protein [Portunus trituberculatus]
MEYLCFVNPVPGPLPQWMALGLPFLLETWVATMVTVAAGMLLFTFVARIGLFVELKMHMSATTDEPDSSDPIGFNHRYTDSDRQDWQETLGTASYVHLGNNTVQTGNTGYYTGRVRRRRTRAGNREGAETAAGGQTGLTQEDLVDAESGPAMHQKATRPRVEQGETAGEGRDGPNLNTATHLLQYCHWLTSEPITAVLST